MKTRFIAVLLCAVLALTLCACNGKDKDTDSSETTGITESTVKKDTEGKLTTEKNNQEPKVTAGAETNGKDSSAKSGGNTSGGQQPGGKTEETTSTTEPGEKDSEGELVIPSEGIQLPIVDN